MGESFGKKENRNKKAKSKEDKAQRTKDRKLNNNKGKSLEDMLAYVDENGNLSSVPPAETAKVEIDSKDIRIGATPRPEEDPTKTGMITFFNQSKGFGFISDDKSRENIFFHINDLLEPVKERDRVSFIQDRNAKGYFATSVKKVSTQTKN
ncbi:cold shock domain-containing protein [Chitinophaga silvatica]|uniref:Cold shock domain-containing protein n=1 Tax=Chitinophaga silvatica TaxID=2282649 RepID=A0A3E1YGZ3_9BACT|nr:cold shock domain-containing protein [Chitinophaga silvatica]RFS26695.1 cold shock domain-containing protein [Chitinophaga silvatica]